MRKEDTYFETVYLPPKTALTAGGAIDPHVALRQLGCGPLLADGGDKDVLSWAQEIKCPLASIVPYQLRFVLSELQSRANIHNEANH
jgi:hypothetical protein